MIIEVGIENNVEGRSLAWALGHPGCFAYGKDAQRALKAIPAATKEYSSWIQFHNHGESWINTNELVFHQTDSWEVYSIDSNFNLVSEPGYEVNAWFHHDWKPLTSTDVDCGLKLLTWCREDLLHTLDGINHNTLDTTYPRERWSIRGIIDHIVNAEIWYLDRLEISVTGIELMNNQIEKLTSVRELLKNTLSKMVAHERVLGIDGELWSPRKLLRRAVWHERDHTAHIQSLIKV